MVLPIDINGEILTLNRFLLTTMVNHMNINSTVDDDLKVRLIAAAVGLQQCTQTAANLIPLPGTDRFIAIGTALDVARLLEIAPSGGSIGVLDTLDAVTGDDIAGIEPFKGERFYLANDVDGLLVRLEKQKTEARTQALAEVHSMLAKQRRAANSEMEEAVYIALSLAMGRIRAMNRQAALTQMVELGQEIGADRPLGVTDSESGHAD